jgi:hypothetical protein
MEPHPYYQHLLMLDHLRRREAAEHHLRRQGLAQRPRPPGRLRRRAADLLVNLAARLADEQRVALPDRAGAR